ncbi:hypothetical protein V2J09_008078 [Rumex salicifolius]
MNLKFDQCETQMWFSPKQMSCRRVNVSLSRRQMLSTEERDQQMSCLTGNPIDDCWRCDPNWPNNRQRLADCGIGFGRAALGGKGGPFYIVSDPSDPDLNTLRPGTLRDAVSRPGPIWIVFAGDMEIRLRGPLRVTSFKTIDGRGARVGITGGGCISVEHVTNVIIHNINVYGCVPAESDGDGIHVFNAANVWIDHCTLSNCADGLIDCTWGSTAITISNNYFFKHDKVMLLGHNDAFVHDKKMQVDESNVGVKTYVLIKIFDVTVAFNRFGEGVGQRMPRCRFGYIHVVNNDYVSWGIYAIGGSASPTINSQGNRYMAPIDPNAKEVTRRMDTDPNDWEKWDWRTEGDILANGAFFVPSGNVVSSQYSLASSLAPKSASFIDHLTLNAGLLLPNGGATLGSNPDTTPYGSSSGGYVPIGSGFGGYSGGGAILPGGGGSEATNGMIFSKAPPAPHSQSCQLAAIILSCTYVGKKKFSMQSQMDKVIDLSVDL